MTSHLERLQAAIADRYAIEREIGRGGTANVYLAHDLRHDRLVAVKVLRPELGMLLGAERFLREIKVVARLHHPHILPVHDSGEIAGALYYVMPYVEGESLRERLKRERQLPVMEAVRIACEVADALDLAHRRGVIHRDIKPGNILLVEAHAVVADFGIARAVHAAGGEMWETITESGVALGTPAYMSPEQAAGEVNLDARTDIYSLGCVLYEMLVGEPPFAGPGGEVILARRFTDDPPRVRLVRPSVPPEVEEIVVMALARAPADRFASARELMTALSSVPTTGRNRLVDPPKRRRVPTSALLAGAVATAAVLGPWLANSRKGTAEREAASEIAVSAVRPTDVRAPPPAPVPPAPAAAMAGAGATPTEAVVSDTPNMASRPPSPAPQATPSRAASSRRSANEAGQRASRAAEPAPAARLDSVFRAVDAEAQDALRRAAAAGATPAELGAGDSLFAAAKVLAARGRWSDAVGHASTATAVWMEAERIARARRAADTPRARVEIAPSPSPAPEPPSAPPSASPPRDVAAPAATATAAADARAGIDAALARYARAIESRSLTELQQAYPGLTGVQRQSWQRFFDAVRNVRASLTITDVDVTGDVAEAQVVGRYEYASGDTRRPDTQTVAFHATFRRAANAWQLSAVRE